MLEEIFLILLDRLTHSSSFRKRLMLTQDDFVLIALIITHTKEVLDACEWILAAQRSQSNVIARPEMHSTERKKCICSVCHIGDALVSSTV